MAPASGHCYALALGSNRPTIGGEDPRALLERAFAALEVAPFRVISRSAIIATAPLGPSHRCYANAATLVETALSPPEMLARLKQIERARRSAAGCRRGRRWGPRPLDLDVILWSGGAWAGADLVVPHPHFREREFVLGPLAQVAPRWRDPLTGLAVRHLLARLKKRRPDPKPVDHIAPAL